MISVICIALAGLIFGGDLLIKNHMEQKEFPPCGEQQIWHGRILLRRHHNRGIAFNIGEKNGVLVAALSLFMTLLAAVSLAVSLGQRGNHLLRIGLAVLLGGAFSNTYDRLKRKYVVDYISFGVKWKRFRNIVFNFSDFCIITGALLAVLGTAR